MREYFCSGRDRVILRVFLFLWGLLALFYFLFYAPVFSEEQSYIGKRISRIEFHGLVNLGSDELYQVITSRYQKSLSRSAIREDVRKLFATGYFANVIMRIKSLDDDSLAIHYEVEELPQIANIEYIGVNELDTQKFIEKIQIKAGQFYTLSKVKKAAQIIQKIYIENGFFQAEVWYRVSDLDKKSYKVTLSFIIDEGESIPISKINILGTHFLDPDIILGVLEQKESGWFSDSPFQKSKFEEDKTKILAYAKTQGLLDAQIDARGTNYEIRWNVPDRLEKGRVVVITYKVIEGPIKYFGGYSMEHARQAINKELNPPELISKKDIKLKPVYTKDALLGITNFSKNNLGEKFNHALYFRDLGLLHQSYARQGYVFARIRPQIVEFTLNEKTLARYANCLQLKKPKNITEKKCKREASWLDLPLLKEKLEKEPKNQSKPLHHVHFQVFENNLAYVENIIIRGNEKTKEYVIRRELLIKEGQLFNSGLAVLSRQRLLNLKYFTEVDLDQRIGSDQNKMNLIFIVKEGHTGTIQIGGTYSVNHGFSINTQLGENNLNGTGNSISTGLQYGPKNFELSVGWSQPWFYESCQYTTKIFWKEKQQAFDAASDLAELMRLVNLLGDDYKKIRESIRVYVKDVKGDESVVSLDRVKLRIRDLLAYLVRKEEICLLRNPSPWSLGLHASIKNTYDDRASVIDNNVSLPIEGASIEYDILNFSFGTNHQFANRWSHYHSYSPSWIQYSNPDPRVADILFYQTRQGFQFKSALINGLRYSNLDQSFNPTEGTRLGFNLEISGNFLGGRDHYNRYTLSAKHYIYWFDYTFGGLIPYPFLKNWRVVQQIDFRGIFTQVTKPLYNKGQDPLLDPFLQFKDKLALGGAGQNNYGRLRGYSPISSFFPKEWRENRGHHLLEYGTEFRFPIEPHYLFFVLFFDAGILLNTLDYFVGVDKARLDNYNSQASAYCQDLERNVRHNYEACVEWNDPRNTDIKKIGNLKSQRWLYSWGFGFRIQLAAFPFRIYFAQKLYSDEKALLKPIPGDSGFSVDFGIGDVTF